MNTVDRNIRALVTGASSGLGVEFEHLLTAQGVDLVLAARGVDAMESLATQLRATHGVEVHVEGIDLAEPGAAHRHTDQQRRLWRSRRLSRCGCGTHQCHAATQHRDADRTDPPVRHRHGQAGPWPHPAGWQPARLCAGAVLRSLRGDQTLCTGAARRAGTGRRDRHRAVARRHEDGLLRGLRPQAVGLVHPHHAA